MVFPGASTAGTADVLELIFSLELSASLVDTKVVSSVASTAGTADVFKAGFSVGIWCEFSRYKSGFSRCVDCWDSKRVQGGFFHWNSVRV